MQECRRAYLDLLRYGSLPTTTRNIRLDAYAEDPAELADLRVFLPDILNSRHLPARVILYLDDGCCDDARLLAFELLGRECSNVQSLTMADMDMGPGDMVDKLVGALATGEYRDMVLLLTFVRPCLS